MSTGDSEPSQSWKPAWSSLIALIIIGVALTAMLQRPASERQILVTSSHKLLLWFPLLYGIVAVSYAGRYWRWRLLIGIGRLSWADLIGWFRGFALTATPAKLGELNRIRQLHRQLNYPRSPLVHVFVVERIADASAVALLLMLLTPKQLLVQLSGLNSIVELLLAVGVLAVVFFSALRPLRCFLSNRLKRWHHHLPSGALGRAIWPAILISMALWANEALVLWLLVHLLSPAPISIPTAISIYLLSGVIGIASSLPGGVGVNEAVTVLLLSRLDIGPAVALPVAVLRRIITLWSIVVLAAAIRIFWPYPAFSSGRFAKG
jgi:hypothetical protein